VVVGVACVPLKETLLASRVKPRSVPVIVTGVPTGPLVGAIAVRVGVGVGGGGGAVTVKGSPLLTRPSTITTTFPVVAPAEIAKVVGAPVLTVRTRLFYARKDLAQLLRDEPTLASFADAFAQGNKEVDATAAELPRSTLGGAR
jgi:hypothetical protein